MQRRKGFTLVELLVAMALALFIMSILTAAFVTALETFRQLKGLGDLQEGLRTASQRLKADLTANHFEGSRKLSDPSYLITGKPRQGYFYVKHGTTATTTGPYYVKEGLDLDDTLATGHLDSFRAVDHVLAFSVNLRGNRPEDFFQASLPTGSALIGREFTLRFPGEDLDQSRFQAANMVSSQWAEIAYFLGPKTGTTDDATDASNSKGAPLHSLYRVQRIVVPVDKDINDIIANTAGSDYSQLSWVNDGTNLDFNTPENLAGNTAGVIGTPNRGWDPNTPATWNHGASLLLGNVISFQVQVAINPSGDLVFDDAAMTGRVFDTATSGYTIYGARITIRVFDPNTGQTRQITVLQDL
jgi:prepilin-type N-terminal cleavage/methylation domain-containing protein